MPDTGLPYSLRYPALPDAPNVPLDIKNLADDVHARLAIVDSELLGTIKRHLTSTANVSSGAITTTETVIQSLSTVPLIIGKRYKVRWFGRISQTVVADRFFIRLREDSVTGTVMQLSGVVAPSVEAVGYFQSLEAEYVAASTGNKTFVFTLQRSSGTGSSTAVASAANPRMFTIDAISG